MGSPFYVFQKVTLSETKFILKLVLRGNIQDISIKNYTPAICKIVKKSSCYEDAISDMEYMVAQKLVRKIRQFCIMLQLNDYPIYNIC
jgi:hypothetical protein